MLGEHAHPCRAISCLILLSQQLDQSSFPMFKVEGSPASDGEMINMYGISVLLFSFTPFVFKLKWHHGKVTEDPSVSLDWIQGGIQGWIVIRDHSTHLQHLELSLPTKKWTNRPPPRPMVTPLVTPGIFGLRAHRCTHCFVPKA